MRLSFGKYLFLIISATILSLAVYQVFNIKSSIRKTLAEEESRQNALVPFEKKVLTPHLSPLIKILQNTNETHDFVKFGDSYFAATGGGLAEFDSDGKLIKHFTVLDGLPESDLTCLATYQNKLFIGTKSQSLIVFDGKTFEQFSFHNRKIESVTELSSADGELLIGTSKGGLLKFDGENFSEIYADGKRIFGVNFVKNEDFKLFVGTFDNGLWIFDAGIWTNFKTAQGLPSNRVIGIVVKDKNIYAATDFGLAILQDKSFKNLAVLPSLSSINLIENQIFLTKDNGEIFRFENSLKPVIANLVLQQARVCEIDDKNFILSSSGIYELKNSSAKKFTTLQENSPTDNFVSALTFDGRENLWIGTFQRGIDVFNPRGEKLKHLESEEIREINFLNSDKNGVSAATSNGLITFNENFSAKNLTKADGLPSNSITHFTGRFTATSKGLSVRENNKIRVISTVQNLPNNSVYTTLQVNDRIYAGTLGGLAEIRNGRVTNTFKDSNSNLDTNWVTALNSAGERVFIGTYGGGIFELLPSGEIQSFAPDAGKFAVNPNALFSDAERLYAGTLTGLKIYDLQSQKWQTLQNVLPTQTVMSIIGDAENIYAGTTNGIAKINKTYFAQGISK